MSLRINVLGPLEVLRGDEIVTPSQPKLRRLLVLLAAEPGSVVRIETITRELWGTAPTDKHCRTIQTYVSQLRKVICPAGALTHVSRVGYRLDGARLDLGDLLAHRDAEEPDTSALALCRGEALADVSLGPVLEQHKARIDAIRIDVLDRYLRSCLRQERPQAVLDQADRITREDGRHEGLYTSLLLAFAAVGRRSEGIDVFHRLRRKRLDDGVGEPGPSVQAAYREVLAESPADTARLCEAPAQLPPDPAGFAGFTRELRIAEAALTGEPGAVAIVGSPGSGKSAFCARLANRVSHLFPDGQLHADLSVQNASEALAGFLKALRPDDRVPDNLHERVRRFQDCTTGARILVFADNVGDRAEAALLRPNSPVGAVLLACPSRIPVDLATTIVELPRLGTRELLEMFAFRVGDTRIEREPEEARALLTRCSGLPIAVASLASLLRRRPHWSIARVLRRVRENRLAFGDDELARSVRRVLTALGRTEREALFELVRRAPEQESMSVRWAAGVLEVPVGEAEQILERLVEHRLTDPVVTDSVSAASRYRIDPLYRSAVREIAEPATGEAVRTIRAW
ncbi:BTAD domain-containing putative transcriptional regulator [Saccharopolyspora taberi]|uniref:AfsR/SARP family transcriptional regulator n=1 Tax=Saccharopolyspora taberi TaxID=60895 RepID=A0ABN3VCW7_9PSEU